MEKQIREWKNIHEIVIYHDEAHIYSKDGEKTVVPLPGAYKAIISVYPEHVMSSGFDKISLHLWFKKPATCKLYEDSLGQSFKCDDTSKP